MLVSNELARDLLELGEGDSMGEWGEGYKFDFQLVKEELFDTSRWSHHYERIYKDLNTGKFYSTTYSRGATECQDERPYEFDGPEVDFTEVVPRETVVIEYVVVE